MKTFLSKVKFIALTTTSPMKAFGKQIFPEIHVNPIQRDLVIVAVSGFAVAAAIIGVLSFVFH